MILNISSEQLQQAYAQMPKEETLTQGFNAEGRRLLETLKECPRLMRRVVDSAALAATVDYLNDLNEAAPDANQRQALLGGGDVTNSFGLAS